MMIKKFLNNRGVALEMAIYLMITLSALSSLIFAATYRNKIRDVSANNKYISTAQIDQVGESFFREVSQKYSSSLTGDDLISAIVLNDAFVGEQELERNITYRDENNYEYYVLTLSYNDGYTYDDKGEQHVKVRVALEVEVMVDKVNKKIKVSKWQIDNPNSDYDYLNKSQKENGFDYEY